MKLNGIMCRGNPVCINGQSVNNSIKNLYYGLSKIANNGCELIAVYNAMSLCGNRQNFFELLNISEKLLWVKWLFGIFGSRPWRLNKILSFYNQKYRKIKKNYNNYLHDNGVYVISFFNYRSLRIHTVAFKCDADKSITVYNRYSNINSSFKYEACENKTGLDLLLEETGKPIVMYELM